MFSVLLTVLRLLVDVTLGVFSFCSVYSFLNYDIWPAKKYPGLNVYFLPLVLIFFVLDYFFVTDIIVTYTAAVIFSLMIAVASFPMKAAKNDPHSYPSVCDDIDHFPSDITWPTLILCIVDIFVLFPVNESKMDFSSPFAVFLLILDILLLSLAVYFCATYKKSHRAYIIACLQCLIIITTGLLRFAVF